MALPTFNPIEVYCSEWKKIYPDYILRPLTGSKSNKTDETNGQSITKPLCSACQNPGNLRRCGGCFEVAYCSTEHQKTHWKKEHRFKCCAYKIVQGDPKTVGRYVVATR